MDDDKEKKEEEKLDAAGKNRCIIIIQSEWIFFQRDTNVMILSTGGPETTNITIDLRVVARSHPPRATSSFLFENVIL